jgi:hypothetical protein
VIEAESILVETDEQLAVRAGAVLVWVTTGQLEDAPLEQLRQGLEAMAAEQPQGVALLMVAIGESELPKLQTRRRIVRGLSSLGERLQAVAATFEGDKPWLSLARATFENIFAQVETAMTGSSFPMRVFGDRVEAVVWLGEVVLGADERPIETDELAGLVDELVARVSG